MKKLTLKIDGMNCDGCAERITTVLEKEPGVRQAQVSFSEGVGDIAYNDHVVREDRIFEVINKAGFSAERA